MNWYKKAQTINGVQQQPQLSSNPQPAFQGEGYSVSVQQYSNKGPLFIVNLQGGREARCYYDVLAYKWKPLE